MEFESKNMGWILLVLALMLGAEFICIDRTPPKVEVKIEKK